jgi:hypothetical protein
MKSLTAVSMVVIVTFEYNNQSALDLEVYAESVTPQERRILLLNLHVKLREL